MTGKLFILSGPSGSGKSTITKIVRDKLNIPLSISATSRVKRVGEVDGVDYFFLTKEEFEEKIKNEEFFEYANVHGNYYGTLVKTVEDILSKGQDLILEIDVQGALICKEKYDNIVLIFCQTEDEVVLEKRLKARNTDSLDVIEKRLENAKKEMEYAKHYDYVIVNKELEKSVKMLEDIIKGDINEK